MAAMVQSAIEPVVRPWPAVDVWQVSSGFAAACDECFKARCADHGWRFPRLPRGETATHKQYPWRSLYRSVPAFAHVLVEHRARWQRNVMQCQNLTAKWARPKLKHCIYNV